MHMIDNRVIPDGEFITIKGVYASVDDGFVPIIKVKGRVGEYSGGDLDAINEWIRGVAKVDFFYIRKGVRLTFWGDELTNELLRVGRVGMELANGMYYPLKKLKR